MVELQGAKVILREKRIEDAEKDYRWRSDPEIARLDAAYPLSMTFERFLKLFEDQLRYPTPGSHHFGADATDGTYIGNCMYYDLDSRSKEAELGIVIGDRDYWSNAYGYDAVTTLLNHMFMDLQLNRVYLHTLDWNERAQRCFSKSGFKPVRTVRRMAQDFILMEVLRQEWLETGEERLAARYKGMDAATNNGSAQFPADHTGTESAAAPSPVEPPLSPPLPRRRSVFPQSGLD